MKIVWSKGRMSTGEARSTSITLSTINVRSNSGLKVRHATYSLSYGTAFRADTTSQLCINANIPILSTVIDPRGANQIRQNNHQNTTVSALNANTSRDCRIAVKSSGNMNTKSTKSLRQVGWSGYPAMRCHPVCTLTCSYCRLLA